MSSVDKRFVGFSQQDNNNYKKNCDVFFEIKVYLEWSVIICNKFRTSMTSNVLQDYWML